MGFGTESEALYGELIEELRERRDLERASASMYYHKTEGHRSYGLRKADFEELLQRYRPHFLGLPLDDRLHLARRLYRSGLSEEVAFGQTLLEISLKDIGPDQFRFLDEVAGSLNSWSSTDWFCIRIMQPLLMAYRQATLELLCAWNRSGSLWKRRASVVAFTRRIGRSGDFAEEALKLCETLVWDREDMVRKGVGWALKDNMRGAPGKVKPYVKDLRRRGVSSIITLYAIRDLKGRERREFLRIRP